MGVKKRLTKKLHAWRFVGSFDAAPRQFSPATTTTTHCPRTTPAKPLHSSKWQGAYCLQLPPGFWRAARLPGSAPPLPHSCPKKLDTDGT